MNMKRTISLGMVLMLISTVPCDLKGQVSPKVVEKRYQEYLDSIQHIDYAYVLPLMGDKARKAGIDLQSKFFIGHISDKDNYKD